MRTEVFTGETTQQTGTGSEINTTNGTKQETVKKNGSNGVKIRGMFTDEEWEVLSKQYSEICSLVEREGLSMEILPDTERTTESVE